MNFFEWSAQYPWLAFICVCAAYYALKFTLRTINVTLRGWPPEHLDADGDWKPEPKKDDE